MERVHVGSELVALTHLIADADYVWLTKLLWQLTNKSLDANDIKSSFVAAVLVMSSMGLVVMPCVKSQPA